MIQWYLKKLPLELKFPWKISRGVAHFKNNYLIEAQSDEFSAHGEVAFNSRYGENEETIERKFEEFTELWEEGEQDLKQLQETLEKVESLPNSLRFGIESAFVHLESHLLEKTVPSVIRSEPSYNIRTSFSIPVQDASQIERFIRTHDLGRFSVLKIKLGHEGGVQEDLKIVDKVLENFSGKLRLDANEAFANADEVIKFSYALSGKPIEFIEQPLSSKDWEGAKEVFKKSQFPIFADESLESHNVIRAHQQCFHGVNVKLMKSGGYYQALKQIRDAKKRGMQVMLGCMVESSLGILSAMHLAGQADYFDLDGFLLLRQDPFSLVEEDKGSIMMGHLN